MTTSTETERLSSAEADQSAQGAKGDDTATRLAARARRYLSVTETEQSDRQEAVCFVRKDTSYGIPLQNLREIRRYAKPCRLPGTRAVVTGIIHYRGVLVSVHDLEGLLRSDVQAPDGDWVVIVEHAGELYGLIADEVLGTRTFGGDEIRPLPVTFSTAVHAFRGLLDEVLLLQPQALFSDDGFISAY